MHRKVGHAHAFLLEYALKFIQEMFLKNTSIYLTAPNCIKNFLDLPDDTGQSGSTLQLFQMVILANQV